LALLLISSCAAPEPRPVPADPDAIVEAARGALRDHADVEVEGATIRAGWRELKQDREQGYLFENRYFVRVRFDVEIDGRAVRIRAVAERRAPGGPRSIRWQRIDPEPFEKELYDELRRRVSSEYPTELEAVQQIFSKDEPYLRREVEKRILYEGDEKVALVVANFVVAVTRDGKTVTAVALGPGDAEAAKKEALAFFDEVLK
jgi:hypothetical protein